MRRLRAWLDRPIDDPQRGSAFVVAAFVIALALTALLLTRPQPPSSRATPDPHPPLAVSEPPAPATPAPARPPSVGVEGGQISGGALPGPAARVARRFLSAYLRRLYGQSSRARVPDATRELSRRLARERVRPVPAVRRRRPRVVELRARHGAHRLVATALVDDGGVARYPIELILARRRGRWLVTALGAD